MISAETSVRLLDRLRASSSRGFALRQEAMALLGELPDYDWSGIYRLEGQMLHLDAYMGDATEHTQIPVGVGVCGTAVAEDANQVIEDVRSLSNYLACSLKTRSEIVVLIRRGGAVLGQIDIDSHRVGAFDASDEAVLGEMAKVLSERWE